VLALRLVRDAQAAQHVSARLWAAALLATAVGAFVGGSYHGIVTMLPVETGRALWKVTLLATGIASACLLGGAVVAATAGTPQRWLLAAVVAKLVVFVWAIATRDQFLLVIADYTVAMVACLLAAWIIRPSGLTAASGWITLAVVVSLAAGVIQARRLAPHPSFNHNDLFHVVQMAALYALYRGGLLLRDMR
jgi:hypothetical protein